MVVIHDIIIEGFKSYGLRTAFLDLNTKFNSVTGTNGSGKSNLLDAICFAMGLSNLNIIRVAKLQDLIFQNEEIESRFALVSIVLSDKNFAKKFYHFQNLEKISLSRKILAGGKNKYFLNGEAVIPAKILNFLYSINININNPHFFVRQGHIMRIARMNSVELLHTVETAFGIKLYQIKKNNALKLIKKKNQKVDEITSLLIDQIRPQLNKIGKSEYIWKKLKYFRNENKKIEFLNDSNYVHTLAFEKFSETQEIKINYKINNAMFIIEKIKNRVNQKTHIIKKNIKNNFNNSSIYSLINHSCALTILQKNDFLNFFFAEKKIERLSAEKKELKKFKIKQLSNEKKDSQSSAIFIGFCQKKKKQTQGKKTAGYLFETLKRMRPIFYLFRKLETDLTCMEKTDIIFLNELVFYKEKFLNIHSRFTSTVVLSQPIQKFYEYGKIDYFKKETKAWNNFISVLSKKIEPLNGKHKKTIWKLRNFIYGNIGSLVHIEHSFITTAFDFSNPTKMKYLVVNNDINSQIILDQTNLKKKISIIPLSKLFFHEFPIKNEKDYASLHTFVSYKFYVSKSITFVFTTTALVFDSLQAKQIARTSKNKMRYITLNGDIFETNGSVFTGKNPEKGFCLLGTFSEHNNHKTWMSRNGNIKIKYNTRKYSLLPNQPSIPFIDQNSENNLSGKIVKYFYFFTRFLKEEIENFKKNHEIGLLYVERFFSNKFINKTIKKFITRSYSSKSKIFYEQQSTNLWQTNELFNIKIKQSVGKIRKFFAEILLILHIFYKNISITKKIFHCNELKMIIIFDRLGKLRCLNESIEITQCSFFFMNLANPMSLFRKKKQTENKSIFLKITQIQLIYHNFIKMEEKFRTHFIWLKKLLEIFPSLRKKTEEQFMDQESIQFLMQALHQYRELIRKRIVIEKDKLIIQHIISKLDLKKDVIMIKSIKKVNIAFQAIFSMLLPGSLAKLVIIRNTNRYLQGIDFRVSFGQTRTQTLEELSGGQKSILSLSYIFSLLVTKPAPFYILDEIDAALDLCHTQNIGKLIKSYFPMSQFIIVSLKNGIIKNAKIIFKIKLVNGTSFVNRIENCN